MEEIEALLAQARNYRRLGNAMYDRQTRLALLELAFEFEERARCLRKDLETARGADGMVTPGSLVPPVQDLNTGKDEPKTDHCAD